MRCILKLTTDKHEASRGLSATCFVFIYSAGIDEFLHTKIYDFSVILWWWLTTYISGHSINYIISIKYRYYSK